MRRRLATRAGRARDSPTVSEEAGGHATCAQRSVRSVELLRPRHRRAAGEALADVDGRAPVDEALAREERDRRRTGRRRRRCSAEKPASAARATLASDVADDRELPRRREVEVERAERPARTRAARARAAGRAAAGRPTAARSSSSSPQIRPRRTSTRPSSSSRTASGRRRAPCAARRARSPSRGARKKPPRSSSAKSSIASVASRRASCEPAQLTRRDVQLDVAVRDVRIVVEEPVALRCRRGSCGGRRPSSPPACPSRNAPSASARRRASPARSSRRAASASAASARPFHAVIALSSRNGCGRSRPHLEQPRRASASSCAADDRSGRARTARAASASSPSASSTPSASRCRSAPRRRPCPRPAPTRSRRSGSELPEHVVERSPRRRPVPLLPGHHPGVEVRRGEERVVVEHLLEVRDEPACVRRSSGGSRRRRRRTCRPRPSRRGSCGPSRAPRRRRGGAGARARTPAGTSGRARSRRTRARTSRAKPRLGRVRAGRDVERLVATARAASLPPERADERAPPAASSSSRRSRHAFATAGKSCRKLGMPVPRLRREVRAARRTAARRGEEHGRRPAALAGHRDARLHRQRVDVGPLLAVDLDVDEELVHERRRRRVLERLVLHHVAPVARSCSRPRARSGLSSRAGARERLFAPRVPVDRVRRRAGGGTGSRRRRGGSPEHRTHAAEVGAEERPRARRVEAAVERPPRGRRARRTGPPRTAPPGRRARGRLRPRRGAARDTRGPRARAARARGRRPGRVSGARRRRTSPPGRARRARASTVRAGTTDDQGRAHDQRAGMSGRHPHSASAFAAPYADAGERARRPRGTDGRHARRSTTSVERWTSRAPTAAAARATFSDPSTTIDRASGPSWR